MKRCRDQCLSSGSLASNTHRAFGLDNLKGPLPSPSDGSCAGLKCLAVTRCPGLSWAHLLRVRPLLSTLFSLAGPHKYHRVDCDPAPEQPGDRRPRVHGPARGPLPGRPFGECAPPPPAGPPRLPLTGAQPCGLAAALLTPQLTMMLGEGGVSISHPLSLHFSKKSQSLRPIASTLF